MSAWVNKSGCSVRPVNEILSMTLFPNNWKTQCIFFCNCRIKIKIAKRFAYATQKMKFSIKDFFSQCDQIRSFLRIWSHVLKKSSMGNVIFLCGYIFKIWKTLFLYFWSKLKYIFLVIVLYWKFNLILPTKLEITNTFSTI